jgi:polyisoprenoid-binding protein YceI
MTHKTLYLGLYLGLVFLSSVHAQSEAFPIDDSHSYIGFKARFGGLVDVQGRFKNYYGVFFYDENDLNKLSVTAFIETASIETGADMRDDHLKSEDFFDGKKFPYLSFSSTSVENKNGQFLLHGSLTMKGVAKTVSIPFQRLHGIREDPWENRRISFSGQLTLKRSDFGIGTSGFWGDGISDEITIDLNISARIFNKDKIGLLQEGLGKFLYDLIEEKGVDAAIQRIQTLQTEGQEAFKKASFLNWLAEKCLQYHKISEAAKIYELNVRFFPEEHQTHSGLAYARFLNRQPDKAKSAAEKALAINDKDAMALELLKCLAGKK